MAVGFAVRSSVTLLLRHFFTKPAAPLTDLNRTTDTKNITCEKNTRELAPIATIADCAQNSHSAWRSLLISLRAFNLKALLQKIYCNIYMSAIHTRSRTVRERMTTTRCPSFSTIRIDNCVSDRIKVSTTK